MSNVKQKGTLYLNMIVAETEPVEMVTRGIDTVKDYVDGMYITVTYKETEPETSPLIDTLTSYGAKVSFFKWIDNFAAARQYAMDQVPQGKDTYIYWQDVDDVLEGAEKLPEALQTVIDWKWAGAFFPYFYRVELDDDGNVRDVLVHQERERIIRHDGTYKWKGMLHETLIGVRVENFEQHKFKDCAVIHKTTEERVDAALERNIRILEKQMAEEEGKDPRTLVYLAKAYYDQGQELMRKAPPEERLALVPEQDAWFDRALDLFDKYLNGTISNDVEIEGSGWPEERASAWQYMSQIFLLKESFQLALDAINNAIEESPTFPAYYIDKAVIYTHLKEWERARHWLTVGTNVEIPETTLMISPRDMKVRALECDAHIAMHDQDIKRVISNYQKLLEVAPDNDTYKQNLMASESIHAANQASQSVIFLAKYLTRIGEEDKILPLLSSVPQDLQREPFYAQMRHAHIPARMWDKDEIALVCGPGFEQWSPNSIEKGLGGSEEAVVYLSQELSKQGFRVTVYANPEYEEGEFDGVKYENYYKLNPKDYFNHLILWRGIGFADLKPKVQGKVVLWLHDMPNLPDFTEERLEYIDKIAVLSDFHRQQIKMARGDSFVTIPDSKFFLTRNGIPDLGITTWKGDPHRLCYVSSPDRGLIYLLKAWPDIKKAVPDASLHIYYGFDIYDFIHRGNPSKEKFKAKIMELMNQPGIVYHGRVGHQELATEMNKCGVWAYPTDFTEISCISAMKAQATGSVPVVTNFAALQETVRNGIKVDVDIQEKEGRKDYFDALIDLLKDPKKQDELRNIAWAQSYYSWENVGNQWGELLRGNVAQPIVMTPKQWETALKKQKGGRKT